MLGLLAEWYPSLPGAPPGESCTQAATVIESYLYPTRTGHVGAHGGHSRARRGRTVKMKITVLYLCYLELAFETPDALRRQIGYGLRFGGYS